MIPKWLDVVIIYPVETPLEHDKHLLRPAHINHRPDKLVVIMII